MNMIEVDPKLFVKCRLCLEETGQYQIVPKAQMQIKYCFDIDVAPFDGLPQLVCKKCESILTQYAGIKQIFQEKQKNLKSKINANVKIDSIIQQQDTVSSTQADTENNKNKLEIPSSSKINRNNMPVPQRLSSTETLASNSQRKSRNSTESKSTKRKWQKTYTKHFVCRFCAKTFKDKKGINTHISKHCKLFRKYSSINKSYCLVALNKIGAEPNITGSRDTVVCYQNKIVQSRKANYYILYTKKSKDKQVSSSESSDEDFFASKRKHKRRRLISRSSSETVVIDNDAAKSSDDEKITKANKSEKSKIVSDIEYVNIEDSDSTSTKSSVKKGGFDSDTHSEKTSAFNDKMVNNIIAMCYNKFMNRLNAPEGSTAQGHTIKGKEESSLKHKILSIGRKVIYGSGINTTGLLRYMEHKNLEVVWVPTKIGTKVVIKTRTKESGDNDVSNHGWENITSLPYHNQITQDFALDFERISELEERLNKRLENQSKIQEHQCSVSKLEKSENELQKALINSKKLEEHEMHMVEQSLRSDAVCEKASSNVEKSETKIGDNTHLRAALDAEKNWKKLLNANPVANPKQLPKKNSFNEPASIIKVPNEFIEPSHADKDNEMLHMPIITSTVSLAPPPLEQTNVECSNQNTNEPNKDSSKLQPNLPKIKVKPVSELMSDKALSQQNNEFVSTSGWRVNENNQSPNVALQATDNSMVYIGPFTNVVPMQQELIYYSQGQGMEAVEFNPANQSVAHQLTQNRDVVKMHTVELPNTRTDVPLRYLQKLLQIHNIILLDSTHTISHNMQCLSKFKVLFEQETTSPVRLCLMLLCENNVFCIKVRDHFSKELDVAKFSANWQWEILQVFRGDDVVSKLLSNAMKLGNATLTYTTYFTNLLKSIVYTRET